MLKLAFVFCFAYIGIASAEVVYTPTELQRVRERAIPAIQSVMRQDIVPRLPTQFRDRASRVQLKFPERGPGPMSFYAAPARQEIFLPLTSLRFYDDIATLHAWFEARNCPQEYIQTYLAALLRAGEDLPAPLVAFGLDRDKLFADSYTYDLSGKIFSSGVQFLLAHELGHVLLDHRTGIGGEESQRQEAEADAFALDHFARLGGNPMGIFWYYQAAWWHDPASEKGRRENTHPVSADRIRAMAARLRESPGEFAHGEVNPAREAELISQLGMMTAEFANLIDDDSFLSRIAPAMFNDFPLSNLRLSCPH
ncbi:hypothetical protein [uncultured Roseovarius sp.]|uniref:hypothetical protein n=1 Tax=uncultured Roseovarius sp. TaxID=293344 RepID=UPI0026218F30|nr:hypothetical protein [uncultured Roseovarius sp.]